jgi:predicted Kef-type K+ transport protein
MQHESLLLNLAVCLAAALICGWLANRLRFSPIVGYLVAGIICGPFTPGFVAEPAIAEQLSTRSCSGTCPAANTTCASCRSGKTPDPRNRR